MIEFYLCNKICFSFASCNLSSDYVCSVSLQTVSCAILEITISVLRVFNNCVRSLNKTFCLMEKLICLFFFFCFC